MTMIPVRLASTTCVALAIDYRSLLDEFQRCAEHLGRLHITSIICIRYLIRLQQRMMPSCDLRINYIIRWPYCIPCKLIKKC